MNCPECGAAASHLVLTKRTDNDEIIRRRRCTECGIAWYSHQPPERVISPYQLTWPNSRQRPRPRVRYTPEAS